MAPIPNTIYLLPSPYTFSFQLKYCCNNSVLSLQKFWQRLEKTLCLYIKIICRTTDPDIFYCPIYIGHAISVEIC